MKQRLDCLVSRRCSSSALASAPSEPRYLDDAILFSLASIHVCRRLITNRPAGGITVTSVAANPPTAMVMSCSHPWGSRPKRQTCQCFRGRVSRYPFG